MKNKVIAFFAAAVLLAGAAPLVLSGAAESVDTKTAQVGSVTALLPASDAVAVMDVKRFFGDALPRVLAGNQPILDKITTEVDKIQTQTGIDLRQFDQVAVGMTMKPINAKDYDVDPVVIARGNFNLASLISVAKIGSKGAYREEKIGTRTVSIFSIKNAAKKAAPKTAKPAAAGSMVDRSLDKLLSEIAVMAIDTNTIALGSLPRVRQTANGGTHLSADLVTLLSRRPTSIVSFAAKTPPGMAKMLPMENDEFGKNLSSIRFLAGAVDVADSGAVMQLMARTELPDQAQSLLEMVQGLQTIGKAFLGSATTPEKQVFGRMIENAQLARVGNDVTLDLSIPQSDIDILVSKIK